MGKMKNKIIEAGKYKFVVEGKRKEINIPILYLQSNDNKTVRIFKLVKLGKEKLELKVINLKNKISSAKHKTLNTSKENKKHEK